MTDEDTIFRFDRQERDEQGRYINVWKDDDGKELRTMLHDPENPADWHPDSEA